MISGRLARLIGLLLATVVIASACTGSSDASDSGPTTTEADTTASTIDTATAFVDACRSEMLQNEPDIQRLAIDPTLTNLALGLLPDEVEPAAVELADCLGDDLAEYLTADLIIAGQVLPSTTTDCLVPWAESDGAALTEMTLRRVRLETPSEEVGQRFVDAMLECVPGRFLAAPIQSSNLAGYVLAVDEACLDEAHAADSRALELFWSAQLDPDDTEAPDWDADDVDAVVAPLYSCVDTGDFIAADPEIGASLSAATRDCFDQVATDAGYWESRVAQQPFDEAAYQAATDACLTPEEALFVLGRPIPVDDPEESNFEVVATCHTEILGTDPDDQLDELAGLDDEQLGDLIPLLVECAGTDGVAGRYAATTYNNRALPEGTYDCAVAVAPADVEQWLLGILAFESGRDVPVEAGAAYIDTMSRCVPAQIYTRPVLRDFSAISSAIDAPCIDDALPSGSDATAAYWDALVFGASDESETPTEQAVAAADPLYACVNAGDGFELVVAAGGVRLSDETRACIDESLRAVRPIETAMAGNELPEDAFNGAIADCLTDEEVEAIRG